MKVTFKKFLYLGVFLLLFFNFVNLSTKLKLSVSREEDEENNIIFIKKNIWNLSETFLPTPFYDGQRQSLENCLSGFKFEHLTTPFQINSEILDMEKLPSTNINEFYAEVNGKFCLTTGYNSSASNYNKSCICNKHKNGPPDPQYLGEHCDIPRSVWKENGLNFQLRKTGRRAVMGILVNFELDLVEIKVQELHRLVDIFVIVESNVTLGGDPKPLYFFNAFTNGYLCNFQDQIIYKYIDHYPPGYIEDGWKAEFYLRNSIGEAILQRIKNLNDEDLIISLDADEMPKPEAIAFLKFHNGFYNPVEFNMRWTLYRYYWEKIIQPNTEYRLVGVTTFDFFRDTLKGMVEPFRHEDQIRRLIKEREAELSSEIDKSTTRSKTIIEDKHFFKIGSVHDYGGFHCSWCSNALGISVKLRSAINADFPRWGNYPEKLDLNYIERLIQTGYWFDGSKNVELVTRDEDPDFAPEFVLKHSEKYQNMLTHPESN